MGEAEPMRAIQRNGTGSGRRWLFGIKIGGADNAVKPGTALERLYM